LKFKVLSLCLALTALSAAMPPLVVAQADVSPLPSAAMAGELNNIDAIAAEGIREHRWPGAVVVIGHDGHVIFRRAYGMRSLVPDRETMTTNTIFDMASLTKILATATSVMQLYEEGKIGIDDPVAKYLPEFAANGKGDITIRELLTHYSGLPPDLDLREPWTGQTEGMRRDMDAMPMTPPGVAFRYSDLNFITLGALVEKVSGEPLNVYAAEHIYTPLHMTHTGFLPPASERDLIAPTEWDEHHHMERGVVEDPTSRRMGGVAGHAGVFSTADDVSIFAQQLLDRMQGRASDFPLKERTLLKMTSPESPATGTSLRGFGWDIDSPFSSNRGTLFPIGSFGHTGYTGTSLWMDPTSDTYVIVLSNAVHPDGPKGITALRGRIADVAATAVGVHSESAGLAARLTGYNESLTAMRRWPARNGVVRTGIDVLEEHHFDQLAALAKQNGGHLRLGLLTNQCGVDIAGKRTIDVLVQDAPAAVPGLKLTTLFSPEHGINGVLDQSEINSSKDAATGLPIVSLYGPTEADRKPSPADLRKLDAVVIDLQDVGVRYYTYESVMRYFLEAAGSTGTRIVILDRPDPVGGSFVQGPVADASAASYVVSAAIPVRHGMTMGELARYMNGELHLNAPLTVIAMEGWERGDWFDSTGLAWINPSPNLHSVTEETLYTGLGLIETTNISVGRGTDTPFEMVGAPWVHELDLAAYLNARRLPGVRFVPTTFTPAKPYPYGGELCRGVNIVVTSRNELDGPELGMEIASALHKLYAADYKLERIGRLLGNQQVEEQIEAGMDPQHIAEDWQAGLDAFILSRKPYLLY
jgi:uncharacterized protein YbbC (DUF1343 family)/CubicO group peptidase (beta-lactamase class C family)